MSPVLRVDHCGYNLCDASHQGRGGLGLVMQTVLLVVPGHTSQMASEIRPLADRLVEESRLVSLFPLCLAHSSPRLQEAVLSRGVGLPHQLNVG